MVDDPIDRWPSVLVALCLYKLIGPIIVVVKCLKRHGHKIIIAAL